MINSLILDTGPRHYIYTVIIYTSTYGDTGWTNKTMVGGRRDIPAAYIPAIYHISITSSGIRLLCNIDAGGHTETSTSRETDK